MGRFSNLEFGGKDKPGQPAAPGEAIRDERFFADRARTAWLAGDFEEALLNFSRALEQNSACYDGWFGQVRMLIELGEYREAKTWADKALELFPEHPELLAAKAVACVRDAEFKKGRDYSDNAMGQRGVTAYVWLSRAEVLLARRGKMAETCLGNAVAAAGSDAPLIRLEAGRILLARRHYPAALEYLQKAAGDLPTSALVWYELGRCQGYLGLPEASAVLEQCLKLRPGWAAAEAAARAVKKRGFLSKIAAAVRWWTGR